MHKNEIKRDESEELSLTPRVDVKHFWPRVHVAETLPGTDTETANPLKLL